MPVTFDADMAVFLPGTGSDAEFIGRALGPAAAVLGVGAVTVSPGADPVRGYFDELDAAYREHGRIIVGGVSIGAMVGAQWALAFPSRAAGVIAAMPAWCGAPVGSPAAASAALTAHHVEEDGLEETIAAMRASSPVWLGDELSRSWRGLRGDLVASMRSAAGYVAPTTAELSRLAVPVGIVGVMGDPLHNVEVARAWEAAIGRSALETISLDELGADPSVLASAGTTALQRATRR